jgi:nucleoside-diphosphate-sugar epimerase
MIVEEDLEYITEVDLPWDELEGTNVLITGANGVLPSYMVETILYLNKTRFKKKARIYAIVRNYQKARKRFHKYRLRKDIQFIVQDIRCPLEYLPKTHYVIHAASLASPKYYGTLPVDVLIPNTIGTYNCLEFAKRNPVKSFLFFSSGEVYGNIGGEITETTFGSLDPMYPRACYAESKRMGETMCMAYYDQYDVPIKIVRPFHTYGPHVNLDDGRVFADFVSDIINKKDIVLKSRGSASRSFCYLSDATIAYYTVLLKGQSGEAYNVGGFETGIRELAERLASEYNLMVITGTENSGYPRVCPDITKIGRLGWTPKVSVQDGFRRTVRSFHESL